MSVSDTKINILELNCFVKRYANDFGMICNEYIGKYLVVYGNEYEVVESLTEIKEPKLVKELYIAGLKIEYRNIFKRFVNLERLHGIPILKTNNIGGIFADLRKLTHIYDLDRWDMRDVQNMRCMFKGCYELTRVGDIGGWDVSNVKNMGSMFVGCYSLSCIGNISAWDVSKVTDMSFMFNNCHEINNIGNLGRWNIRKVKTMDWIFFRCHTLTSIGNLDVSRFKHSACTMFKKCDSLDRCMKSSKKLPKKLPKKSYIRDGIMTDFNFSKSRVTDSQPNSNSESTYLSNFYSTILDGLTYLI